MPKLFWCGVYVGSLLLVLTVYSRKCEETPPFMFLNFSAKAADFFSLNSHLLSLSIIRIAMPKGQIYPFLEGGAL
jgi:hypothetical protein